MEKQEKVKKKRGLAVKVIAYAAAFVALSVVANIFTVYMGVNQSNVLGFNYTVCFFGGAFLGPFVGFIVGACGDALGWLIRPTGEFNPFVMIVSGLIGTVSGTVFWIAKKCGKGEKDILLTVIAYFGILLICTNLNTVALYFTYNMSAKYSTFWAYFIVRTPRQILFWAINLVLCVLLIKPFRRIIKL